MRGKRGDVDVQFNWVFVFIVGALILLIAVGFVTTQKKSADTIIASQIIRFTRSVITHSISTSGKTEFLPLQKEIGTTCDASTCSNNGCTSELFILPKSLRAYISTPVEPIFSPSTIKGTQMMTWTMEWSLPYHAINFIYLTSGSARYILVGKEDDSLLNEIYKGLPETMKNKEKLTPTQLSSIKNRNNYKLKLVFFDSEPQLPSSLRAISDNDLTAVKIIPTLGAELGKLEFYRKVGSSLRKEGEQAFYLGRSSLYGAIFTENSESYTCNLRKALSRLRLVNELYKKKLTTLSTSPDVSDVCKSLYSSTASLPELQKNPSFDQIQELFNKAAEIKATNDALKTKSCPVIY